MPSPQKLGINLENKMGENWSYQRMSTQKNFSQKFTRKSTIKKSR
jgi:hypothetical protein